MARDPAVDGCQRTLEQRRADDAPDERERPVPGPESAGDGELAVGHRAVLADERQLAFRTVLVDPEPGQVHVLQRPHSGGEPKSRHPSHRAQAEPAVGVVEEEPWHAARLRPLTGGRPSWVTSAHGAVEGCIHEPPGRDPELGIRGSWARAIVGRASAGARVPVGSRRSAEGSELDAVEDRAVRRPVAPALVQAVRTRRVRVVDVQSCVRQA